MIGSGISEQMIERLDAFQRRLRHFRCYTAATETPNRRSMRAPPGADRPLIRLGVCLTGRLAPARRPA